VERSLVASLHARCISLQHTEHVWYSVSRISGLSRLSDQGWLQCLGGSRPNPFCECAIKDLRTTFYIVMCDINMTTFDHGELTVLGYTGSRIFLLITLLYEAAR